MDAGAAGGAMIFFSLTAAQVLLSLFTLAYASHSLTTVIEQTAAGNDIVTWPDEPYIDWVWKLFHIAWLVALSFLPAYLLLDHVALPRPKNYFALALIPWLLFPVVVLSSLTGSSRWTFLRPDTVFRLLRRLDAAFVFYLGSAFVLSVCGALLYGAIRIPFLIPVAAAGIAAGFLVYGRLLGRLAWLLYRPVYEEDEEEEEPPIEMSKVKTKDPWAIPKEKTRKRKDKERQKQEEDKGEGQWSAPGEAAPKKKEKAAPSLYAIREDEPAKNPSVEAAPAKKNRFLEEGSYGMLPAPEVKEKPKSTPIPTASSKAAAAREEELAAPRKEPPPPPFPFFSGVYTLPFYPECFGSICAIGIGLTLIGCLGVMQLQFLPR